jgi:selenocysteine-specific elongation factor
MRRLILGTAGHIDHGKTALVQALTGIDTDRLPEEKQRGITIDLGFARLPVSAGLELAIVDVPGHEAFVRNMLAGATGIDLVMLVIAADEGVMPQTREHLAIMELLGISRGVVALTKVDIADAEWIELVRDEVRTLLEDTRLADAAIIDVSARTGVGLQSLIDALAAAAEAAPLRPPDDLFRMPIDRIFTVRGTGTVVTGTVWSGTLRRGEAVRIEPAGAVARLRVLQRHGAETDAVMAGERAAIALAGFDRHALRRGDALLTGAAWRATSMLTVRLDVISDAAAPVQPRQRVRLHLGTAEVLGRLALPDGPLAPGHSGLAQLRLEAPVVARAGDRFVIRSYSPVHTIAGGVVLEPDPPKRKRFAAATADALRRIDSALGGVHCAGDDAADSTVALLDALLSLAGATGVRRADLPLLTGLAPAAADALCDTAPGVAAVGETLVHATHLDDTGASIREALGRFHLQRPLEEGMERESLRREAGASPTLFDAAMQRLLADGTLASRDGGIALAGHAPVPTPEEQRTLEQLVRVFEAAGLEPPDVAELPADLGGADAVLPLLRHLERQGSLIRISQHRWADRAAAGAAAAALRSQLPIAEELPIADLKRVLGLSRKHLIPLLEYFDRIGVCVRRGEARLITAAQAADGGSSSEPPGGGATKS